MACQGLCAEGRRWLSVALFFALCPTFVGTSLPLSSAFSAKRTCWKGEVREITLIGCSAKWISKRNEERKGKLLEPDAVLTLHQRHVQLFIRRERCEKPIYLQTWVLGFPFLKTEYRLTPPAGMVRYLSPKQELNVRASWLSAVVQGRWKSVPAGGWCLETVYIMMENLQNVLCYSQQKTGTAAHDRSQQVRKWHSQGDEEGEKIPRLPYKIMQFYEITRNLTNCVKCWLWRILFGGPLHEFGTFVSVCPSGVHEDAHLSVSPPQHPYLLYQRCRPCSLFKRRFFWDTGDATADLCSKNHSFAIHRVT